MADEQGTEETLQEHFEIPQQQENVSQETEELSDEQKEELAVQEEVKKHIKEDDPESVQKRINQVIRKQRQEERARKAAEKKENEITQAFNELKEHNKKLYDAMMRQATATENLIESQQERENKNSMNQELSALNERIAYLKQERVKARQDMDFNRESIIDDQIDQLKEALITKRQEAEQQKDTSGRNGKSDKAVIMRWAKNTSWFLPEKDGKPNPDYDEDMAAYALGKDKKFYDSGEWKDVPIEDRLAEVKKITEEKFAKRKGVTSTPSPESARNLPPSKKQDSIQLTEEQKNTAHKVISYLPAQEAEKAYAEQLKFINGGR